MFATYQSKPTRRIDRPNYDKPLPSAAEPKKREHRNARVYQPNLKPDFPSRPQTARLPAERPAPILALPGLPPRPFTPSARDQERMYGSPKWFDGAGTLLAKFRPPWSREPAVPKSASARPTTPVTGTTPRTPRTPRFLWQSEMRSPRVKDNRTLADFDNTLPPNGEFALSPKFPIHDIYKRDAFPSEGVSSEFDPPPLYKKDAPEGGVNAWRTLAGAFLIQFCTMGYLFTWDVFQHHYAHVWFSDESPIVIRLIICVQLFFAFGLSLVAGKLSDLGWVRIPMAAGSALFALSLILLSVVPQEAFGGAFFLHGIGMGLGLGFTFVPSAIVVMPYFQRRRGLMTGAVLAGNSLGAMIFPALLRKSIVKHGFGGGTRVTAFIIVPLLIIGNLAIVKAPAEAEPMFPVPHLDLAKYKSEKEYIFAGTASIAALFVIFFPPFYLRLLGLTLRVDPLTSANTLVILSFTGVMGRILAGFAADTFGLWNTFLVSSGLTTIMMISLLGVHGAKGLVAYSIFFGFFAGGWFSLMITALASLASRMSEVGTRIGLVLSLSSPLFLFAPLLYNVLLTRNLKWTIPSVVLATFFLGVSAAIFIARVFMVRRNAEMRRKLFIRWHFIPGILII